MIKKIGFLLILGLFFSCGRDVTKVMDENPGYVILDVRDYRAYSNRHIPGAINIPYKEVDEESVGFIEKDQLIIVYCDKGYKSGKALTALEDLGYTNIYNLKSINKWKGEYESF